MPSTINVIPDIVKGQLRKSGGSADANLSLQTNSIDAVKIDNAQNANFVSTGAITLPSGTTAQRPASPVNGMWRYNTNYAGVEAYANGSWLNLTPIRTPINSVAPVISGSPTVGANVTVTTGTWNNSPTSYGYQWLANSTAIANATANVFTITSSELGANLSCNVTATNSAGSTGIAATSNTAGPVVATFSVQYLVIAGGGSGGGHDSCDAGGGGAGGVLTGYITGVSHGTVYTATVGAGGAGGNYGDPGPVNGSNSTLSGSGLSTVTCYGGGAGGNGRGGGVPYGLDGGSGGGGSGCNSSGRAGGSGVSGQGYAGAATPSNVYGGAGGGGAGGAGSYYSSGAGGPGIANPIAGSTYGQLSGGTYYVAGGGGGGQGVYLNGGIGGGGTGGSSTTYNNGGGGSYGGGGGGSCCGGQQPTSAGGDGAIILSVPTASFSNTYTGTVTITTSGANTIITFTGSGTYTS